MRRQNQISVSLQSDDQCTSDGDNDKSALRLRCGISRPHLEAIDVSCAYIYEHRPVTMREIEVSHLQSLNVSYDRSNKTAKPVAITRSVELARYDALSQLPALS